MRANNAENAFDELKIQWNWGGFVTEDLDRTRIMVRLNKLSYNWSSLFVRMDRSGTVPRSRDESTGIGRVTRHSRQMTLLLTVVHSAAARLRERSSR